MVNRRCKALDRVGDIFWTKITKEDGCFGQVASSFQFLVSSWTTIIELISIYKRLKAFDAAINKQPLPKIEQDFVESGSKEI